MRLRRSGGMADAPVSKTGRFYLYRFESDLRHKKTLLFEGLFYFQPIIKKAGEQSPARFYKYNLLFFRTSGHLTLIRIFLKPADSGSLYSAVTACPLLYLYL